MDTNVDLRRPSSSVLVGRRRELELLVRAVIGPPSLVLVEGEAGVGKSRLLQEMGGEPEIGTRQLLVGHCPPLREPFLLGPFVEALRTATPALGAGQLSPVAGALRPLLPELSHHLPPSPSPLFDSRAERHRIFRALREVLASLGPAICVLEDVHWADEGTFDFLQFLLPQPPPQLALVLSHREEDLSPSSPLRRLVLTMMIGSRSTISLASLGPADVGRLMAAILDVESVPEELVAEVHLRTGGVPFVVEEVVRLLQERHHVPVECWTARDVRRLHVPPALRDSILERTSRVPADARRLIDAAAVIGLPSSEHVLSEVAGLPVWRSRRALSTVVRSWLLVEQADHRFGLRHPLATQAVYEAIPHPERRRLHLRAAQALGAGLSPLPLAQLAHHYRQADVPLRAAELAEAAATAADSVGDDRAAARFLHDALSTPGLSEAATIRMAVKLGTAALFADAPQLAIDILRRVLDEEELTPVVRGELRFSLARLLYHAGDARCWYDLMVRAVGDLESRPELAARAMSNLARPRLMGSGVEENLAWLERALRTDRRQHDPAVSAAVLCARAAVLLGVGDASGWTAVKEMPWHGPSVDERLELVRGAHHAAVAALLTGHHHQAEHLLGRGDRILDELEHVRWRSWLQMARVSLDHAMGRWEGLERRALRLLEATSQIPVLSLESELVVGSMLLAHGELDDAVPRLVAVLEAADKTRSISGLVHAAGRLASAHLLRGDRTSALEVAARGIEALRSQGTWVWMAPIAHPAVEALLADGRRAEADRLLREMERGLRGRTAPAARAGLASARGALADATGRPELAAGHFAQAARCWARLPHPYEAAQARKRRGRSLLAQGDQSGASLLLQALEDFAQLGAAGDGAAVRCVLRAHAVALPYPWRGGRRSYGPRLSPREAEVARLAGMGQTNREIAEALFLSPRTVEGHVTSARRKLGAASRRELAALDLVTTKNA